MSDATTYNEEQFIGRSFEGSAADAAPDPVYVCLWATNPANAPDHTNEVSGDSYAPEPVAATGWTRTSTGEPTEVTNGSEINFGVLNTAGAVTIEGVVISDGAETNLANFLFANNDISVTVAAGNEFKINPGNATFAIY